ncbi:MAG: hypothetical protein ACFFAX_11410, partial [Promethearchaeota archaeon]
MKARYVLMTMFAIAVMTIGMFSVVPAVPTMNQAHNMASADSGDIMDIDIDNFPNDVFNSLAQDTEPGINENVDIGLVLQDKENNYQTIFEPWKTKAAIHAVAFHEPTGFLALGGGYLYDNEVHIWRLNPETGDFDKVWDSGDSLLRSDVFSLAWGDTDLNDFIEVAAASADGFVYLFEQRHIYDPQANTENMFDHVWTSPHTFRAFDVKIYDADRDYREDIIIGGWDGKVRCFEYDDHSNYPFSEEHWISFREVWNSNMSIDGRIYTIGYGDTNFNGLPEIIAGTREGRVYVFENDGIHLMINGEPFPLINDNNYKLVWTSENYTWTPILDMKVGELDGTPGEEIALVAQGQGVFVLNWDEFYQRYDYHKVFRPWDAWQTSEVAPWRLDFWADSLVRANNVTSYMTNGTPMSEPIEYIYMGAGVFEPDTPAYPYNTAMANSSDFNYSWFRADLAPNATALIDFGKDEEGTGSASADWDIILKFSPINPPSVFSLNISIGQSSTHLEQIDMSRMFAFGEYLFVDVDDVLSEKRWDWFRYLEIIAYNGELYAIDSIELQQVYTQLATALSVEIGPLPENFNIYGPPNEPDRLIVSDVVGNFYAFSWNGVTDEYDLMWDSSRDEFYTLGDNVWDIVYTGSTTNFPLFIEGAGNHVMNPFPGPYGHWTLSDMEFWEVVGSTYPHEAIVVDDRHSIRVFEIGLGLEGPTFLLDPVRTAYFNDIETEITAAVGPDANATVETAVLQNPFLGPQSLAVVGVFDPNFEIDSQYGWNIADQIADIYFFERAATDVPYETLNYKTMADLDDTGDIVVALSNAKTVPRMKFGDWDGDFDLDMILSTGFLYYCENIGYQEDGWSRFRMVPGYFASLNTEEEMNDYWGQPEMWDINKDGEQDLILSYDRREGATCYLNDGTAEVPKWVKTKKLFSNTRPETNLKFNHYTDIRVAPMGWGLMQDYWYDVNSDMETFQDAEYTIMAFKQDTNDVDIFWPVYSQSSSYIVATYPTVKRLEFAIQYDGAYDFGNNFGYHVMESWNTEDDLEDWTLTVRTGDVDADGKGEVIVGDYDNNIYVFEHMLNNTYKRAFRSFDINHTEVSDTSPYMWEELEGISGTFNRVIWDHVKYILADCDIDDDGLKELIAAAGLQVYVFEDTGIDDTYDLAYTFDMRDNPSVEADDFEHATEVTALGMGDDFDLNGENELIIAVGPFLFVYNIPYNTWTYQYEYFMRSVNLEGPAYLVGNGAHEDFKEAWIDTLALSDLDEDGRGEIVIGGRINTTLIREDGFVAVYEWRGASFGKLWEAPANVTTWNPITSVAIDDQDYDSKQEIIIGHTKGFDIWEWTGTGENFIKVDVVTSSPNYPIVPLITTRQGNNINNEVYRETVRGDNDIAYMSWSSNAPIMMVFCQFNRLYFKIYDPVLKEWGAAAVVYSGDYGMGAGNFIDYEPSLFLHSSGTLYLVWKADIHTSITDNYNFYISYWNPGGGNWVTPAFVWGSYINSHYPSLFEFGDGTLGVSFVETTAHVSGYLVSSAWNVWPPTGNYIMFKNWVWYYVYSQDVIRFHDGSEYRYALAISGRNRTLAKTDLDIFVATCNSSFIWNDSPMYQATSSYNNEINPDLGVLAAPERSLVVVYESVEADIEDRIQMSYSNTYMMWRQSEPLATLPQYIIRYELPEGQVVYRFAWSEKVYAPLALCPSVLGLYGGGFMQTHTFDFFTRSDTALNTEATEGAIRDTGWYEDKIMVENNDILWGINPSSRFTHFNIRGVVDLDVGDTDGDGRREVIAGFDNRAGVYELTHSNVGNEVMEHEENWLSNSFIYDVTGVSVYDSNGNEFEEIAVSCERGEVYVFEYEDASTGKSPFLYSESLWTSNLGSSVWESFTGFSHGIVVFDLDGDGKDELIRGEALGAIRAFDDDGTELWANELYTGQPLWLTVANLTPSGQPFVAAHRWDGNLTIIDGTNGVDTAHIQMSPILFGSVMFGDVLGDNTRELLATSIYGYVVAMRVDGTVLWNTSLASVDGLSVAYGNFTGRSNYDVVVSHTNGSMSFLYGNNGTLFYHNNASMGGDLIIPVAVDLNYDGIDEVVVAKDHVWVVDPRNQSIFYNSTFYPDGDPDPPNELIGWLWAEDVDDDSTPEFIYATGDGVYMEEFTSGRAVWSYKPDVGLITDAMLGSFIDGRLGLGICTDEGALIVVDALTGNPLFFDLSSMDYNEVAVGDFDGDELDELAGSHSTNGEILAINEVVPIVPTRPVHTNYYWTEYWNVTSTVPGIYEMDGVWTHDIDNDAIDEFVLCRSDGVIELYDPVVPTLEWQVDINASVYDLQFEDFNLDGVKDLLLLAVDNMNGWDIYYGLDGTSGAFLPGMQITGGAAIKLPLLGIGQFDIGTAAPEFALFVTDSDNVTGIVFYDNTGSWYAVTTVLADDFWPIKAVVGHFNNTFDNDEDIAAIGLTSDGRGSTWIWHGDGVWDWNSTNVAGITVVDIATGNLDNANEQDLISVYRYDIPN